MFLNNRLFVMNIVVSMQHFSQCFSVFFFLSAVVLSCWFREHCIYVFTSFVHISGFTGLSGEDTLCTVVTHCLNNYQHSSMTAQRQESSLALIQLDEHPSHFLLASDPVQGHSGAGEHYGWVNGVRQS